MTIVTDERFLHFYIVTGLHTLIKNVCISNTPSKVHYCNDNAEFQDLNLNHYYSLLMILKAKIIRIELIHKKHPKAKKLFMKNPHCEVDMIIL